MSSIPALLSMLAKASMRLSENCSSLSLFFKEKSLERALKEFRQTNGKIALNSGKVSRHHRHKWMWIAIPLFFVVLLHIFFPNVIPFDGVLQELIGIFAELVIF